MTHCPQDSKVCVDDLCRGSGVCLVIGDPMLERCQRCGALRDDFTDCHCEPEPDFDDDDRYDPDPDAEVKFQRENPKEDD